MRQIILDTETTGLSAHAGDRIIELGCVEMVARKLTLTVPLVVKLTLVRTKSESWRKLKSRRSSSSAGWLSSVGDLAKFWLISANWLVKVLTRSTALCRP